MEILLLNKEENYKELQKENEFLSNELSYQKKTYVKKNIDHYQSL